MNRTRKRVMSILLVLFMLIGSVPGVTLTAYAATSVSTEAELIAALAAGGEIELAGDITLTANINVTADSVIDLNDHTIAGASYNLVPAAGILLTLKGPGSVESTGSLGASWSALKGRVSVTEGAVLSVYSMYLDKVGGVTVTGEGSRLVFTYSVSGSGSVKISEKASVEGQTMNPSTVEISGGATAKLKELYTDRYANKGTITITGEGTTVNAQDAKSGVAIGNSSNKSPIVIKDGAVINDAAYLNSGYSETLTVTDATVHGFTRGASISGTSLLNGTSEFDNISAICGIATIGGAASVTFLESVKTTFESLETLTFLGTPTIRNIGKFDFVNSKGDLYLTQDAGAVFALQDGLAGLDVNLGTSAQVMIHIGNDRSLLPGVARYQGEALPYDFACYEGSVKRNTGDFTAYYGYEEKSAAVFESGENMLQMTTPACKIERSGSTIEYYTIHEAFADAKQGETIELLRDVTYANSVVIPASSGVTEYALELAGYGLTSNTNQHYDNDHIPFVINSGMTLNITDSTEEQTGYIQTDDYEYPMMFNAGTVIIDGGIYCGLLCGAGYSGIDPGYGALNNGYKSIGSDGVYVIKDAYIYHDKDDATRESNGAPSYSLESLSYITLAEHARVDEDFERGDWVNDFYPFTHITNKVIVEFDRNEGSGRMNRQRVAIGEAEALNECTFTRDGYAFTGWNTEADGSGTVYADKETVKLSNNLTLYAQWKPAVTVTFDANGGEGTMDDQVIAEGAPTILTANTLTREGYTFKGWNTEADGSGTAYADKAEVTLDADVTLYAQWEENQTEPITPEEPETTGDLVGEVVEPDPADPTKEIYTTGAAITVTNWKGVEITGITTDLEGKFTVDDLEEGDYNVIAEKDGVKATVIVTIIGGATNTIKITMPEAEKNSVLDNSKAGAYAPVVGGLDTIAQKETIPSDATKLTITLTVTDESNIPAEKKAQFDDEVAQIEALDEAQDQTIIPLDLKLEKTIIGGAEAGTTDIGGTNDEILTIIIPFDSTDKENVTVYRFHSGDQKAEVMKSSSSNASEGFKVSDDSITVFAKRFSTYAIGYDNKVTPSPTPSTGGGTSGYDVTVKPAENGTVEADKKTAEKDETVTLKVKPDNGYTLNTLKVTAEDGTEIEVTKNADGSYSYKQPAGKTTVEATFKLAFVSPDVTGVSDMLITDDHIVYISGYPDGTVRPEGNITRAEVATIFYNLLRDKTAPADKSFPDVAEDAWYAKYVSVLAGKDIMTGYPDGEFKPDQMITRAEFAVVATLFAKEANGGKTFFDVPSDYWAKSNIATAAEYGWITGYPNGTFIPAGDITRGEAATIVNLMLGRVADRTYIDAHRSGLMQFSDLKDDTKWYFYNMHEAINAHDYTMDGAIESWK